MFPCYAFKSRVYFLGCSITLRAHSQLIFLLLNQSSYSAAEIWGTILDLGSVSGTFVPLCVTCDFTEISYSVMMQFCIPKSCKSACTTNETHHLLLLCQFRKVQQ